MNASINTENQLLLPFLFAMEDKRTAICPTKLNRVAAMKLQPAQKSFAVRKIKGTTHIT
jgi:hypothetical protein